MLLGVIPARGGSKGIPRKNLMPIAGKPLIAWSILAARQAVLLDDFLVSTEDAEIASASRALGAPVLDRPAHLAQDLSTTLDVLRHVCEARPEATAILLMQPTSPIRPHALVDRLVQAWLDAGRPDSAATGFLCRYWEWGSRAANLPRQQDPGYFYDDGNLYILSRADILAGNWTGAQRLPFQSDDCSHFEIDNAYEAAATEAVLLRLLREGAYPGEELP